MRSSITVSLAGSAPARSRIARLEASSRLKLPVIWPVPPVIGERMTGAEITLPSSTMAKGRPTFSDVTWPNLCPPRRLKRKLTSGSPVCWSKLCCASTRSSPSTMTRFCTWIVPPPFCIGSVSTSFGGSPGSATRRNSSLAVWPIMFLSAVVSWLPGASISTRFGPCCWMTVSLVPIALMRRFSTSIDCPTA